MKNLPMPDKNALYAMKLFDGLTTEAIERIHARMHYERFRKGDAVLTLGQKSTTLLWIHTGSVKICDRIPAHLSSEAQHPRESVLNVGRSGMTLGEINYLDGKGHSASVIALQDTACFALQHADFRQFLSEYPLLQVNFSEHVGAMLRDKTAKIYCLLRQTLECSIAEQLLMLAEREGRTNAAGQIRIDIPMTQDRLAKMTGHERSSVTHTLTAFRKKNWIGIGNGHCITILDADALRRFSQNNLR